MDFGPAARRLADLLGGVTDDMLDRATPCPAYRLGDLIEHLGGMTLAFTAAASKAGGATGSTPPSGQASRLPADWRARIPRDLAALADAWRDPAAWTGMTQAGGVDLPGEVAGLIALDELVVHGWDVARASGQGYDVGEDDLQAVFGFVSQFPEDGTDGLFGPAVAVPDGAPLLDRLIGRTGRDPSWSPFG